MKLVLGESRFESVFHLIRLILLKDKPQGDLLKEFEKRVFAKNIVAKGQAFVDLVFEYIALYRLVFDDRDIAPADPNTSIRYASLMHIMDAEFKASEWRACILFFAHKFGDADLYRFCLKLEKVFLEHWVKGVRKDERYAAYSSILRAIDSATDSEQVIDATTYDENAIRDGASRENLYSAGFCKYMLLRLELTAAEHESVRKFEARSIEHVLPQSPEEGGDWAQNHDLQEMAGYVNQIGNLVLLSKSKNSSARNFDFATKKDKYLKARVSDYPRSVQVLGYEAWTKETILERTAEAARLVLQDP